MTARLFEAQSTRARNTVADARAQLASLFDERSEEMGGGDPAGFAGGAGGKAPRGEDGDDA